MISKESGTENGTIKKIGVYFICTGRYTIFWKPFFESAEKYLFTDSSKYEKRYLVFTDRPGAIPAHEKVYTTKVKNDPWPYVTLKRWHYLLEAQPLWKEVDYIYFFNATLLFIGDVGQELLPDSNKPLVFTVHPGHPPGLSPEKYTYDRNPKSQAYIPKGEGKYYFMGSLHGGSREAYKELCEEMKRRTDCDIENEIIAKWHDESHLNRYAIDYPNKYKILPHTTLSVERGDGSRQGGSGKIVLQQKGLARWGGHTRLRRQIPSQITIKPMAGLGNQLWQYTAALALDAQCLSEGESPKVWVNASWYRKIRVGKLKEVFSNIYVRKNILSRYPTHKASSEFSFSKDFLNLPPAVTLEGSFQHYRYFELAKEFIKPHLHPIPEAHRQLQKQYKLVALHVSRKEKTKKNPIDLTPLPYYNASLLQIQQRVQQAYILIFSNNPSWVQNYLEPEIKKLDLPYDFINQDEVKDFNLMVRCSHFILANDALSNMAALLGSRKGLLVFVPKIRALARNILSKDYLPKNWEVPPYVFYQGETPKNPVVSVIIPVYNTREYLDRCLMSVCCQTEQNIEIIIIDDASPDNSWELIQDYAARDSRIVPIRHKKNKHLGGARNTGIRAARSEYILFLDSDDYIRSDTIEIFMQKAQKHPTIRAIACQIWGVEEGRLYHHADPCPNLRKEIVIDHPFEAFCTDSGVTHCVWNKLWKKELFIANRVFFSEEMAMEDFEAIPRLLIHVNKILLLPERLVFQQMRPDSIMAMCRSKKNISDLGKVFCMLLEWGERLSPNLSALLKARIFKEVDAYVKRLTEQHLIEKQNNDGDGRQVANESLRSLIQEIDPILPYILMKYSTEAHRNRWWKYARYPWKRKLWIIAILLKEKVYLHPALRPIKKIFFFIYRPNPNKMTRLIVRSIGQKEL